MKISIECKLRFKNPEDKIRLIKAMYDYQAIVRYGIKCLRPDQEAKKKVYAVLNEKFPTLPARTISLATQEDIAATINSFAGLEAKNYPPTMRFDKGNAEFLIVHNIVHVRMAIARPEKGKLEWFMAELMPQKSLTYKYYKHLFETKKGFHLPFKLVLRNGQIYAKITVERQRLIADSTKPTMYVGIDLRAHWLGKKHKLGNPLAVAFLNEEGNFVRQPLLMWEWAEIPRLIHENRGQGRNKVKKVVTNQMGIIVKRLLEYTKDYNPIFKLEDLTGLKILKGPYSKLFYKKFQGILETKSLNVTMINPAFNTQTCSRCGKLGKTSKRTFYCQTCYPKGFNKFINAAVNIAKK
jgi:hypothetical protein